MASTFRPPRRFTPTSPSQPASSSPTGGSEAVLLRPGLGADDRDVVTPPAQAGRGLAADEAGPDDHDGSDRSRSASRRSVSPAARNVITPGSSVPGTGSEPEPEPVAKHEAPPRRRPHARRRQPSADVEGLDLAPRHDLDVVTGVPPGLGQEQVVVRHVTDEQVLADVGSEVRRPVVGGQDHDRAVAAGLAVGGDALVAGGATADDEQGVGGAQHRWPPTRPTRRRPDQGWRRRSAWPSRKAARSRSGSRARRPAVVADQVLVPNHRSSVASSSRAGAAQPARSSRRREHRQRPGLVDHRQPTGSLRSDGGQGHRERAGAPTPPAGPARRGSGPAGRRRRG